MGGQTGRHGAGISNCISPCREKPDIVVSLFDALFNKPNNSTHVAVKYTAVKLIGELGDWIDKNPTILGKFVHECVLCSL